MGRRLKALSEQLAAWRWPPLRQWWQEINRDERAVKAKERADRKARDKKRAKCRCEAYPWPHRPGGGFCRHPDPPIQRWLRKDGPRRYRKRYAGILRQIARASGLHPIWDRAQIQALMPSRLVLAKQLKRQKPRIKYRNMEVTETGIRGNYQTAGPMM
jgi:hypothetical protein